MVDPVAVNQAGTYIRSGCYTRDLAVAGFVISLATAAELADAARAINRRLAGPGFAVRVAETVPLAQTARAHALVESGEARGRVVVTMST